MAERTFTEEDVAALFRRAAELQAEEARNQPSGRPELTLDEVSAIAEVGLDPDHVELAATELARKPTVKEEGGASGLQSSEIVAERRVEAPVDIETIDGIVAELRPRFDTTVGEQMGMPGYGTSSLESIGRNVGWKHTNLLGIETRVLLQPQGDRFRVRVSRQSEWGAATNWTSYAAVIVIIAGLLAAFGSYLLGLLVGVAALLVTLPIMRTLDARWLENQRREVEELADLIADQAFPAANEIAPRSAASDASYRAPEISLPDERSVPYVNRRNRTR